MKKSVKLIGYLSVILLICVCIGQGAWLNKISEVKRNEFCKTTSFVLAEVAERFLNEESILPEYSFSCGIKTDGSFTWGDQLVKKESRLSSVNLYHEMRRLVFYDYLYQKKLLNLIQIDSIYRKALQERGIFQTPVLVIRDVGSVETLLTTDSLHSFSGDIITQPVPVGYEYKHHLLAILREPSVFHSMAWHLVGEAFFLIGIVFCLIWQWRFMKATWQNAKVQTMGMAHLEHELKKPLATMISAVTGIIDRGKQEFTEIEEMKLNLIKVRLQKMAEVTDTMLAALKTDELKVERKTIDIREEMEMIIEMFKVLRTNAKVEVCIEEGLNDPLLDGTYFNCLVINLVDNGIKYGGLNPRVGVDFRRKDDRFVLTVEDNGIGMPAKDLKRVFRQFYRVKDQRVAKTTGFGLGLAFVKKVVDAYGGEIRVESKVGVGSKFVVKFKEVKGEK